jgi:hypothetical protein
MHGDGLFVGSVERRTDMFGNILSAVFADGSFNLDPLSTLWALQDVLTIQDAQVRIRA